MPKTPSLAHAILRKFGKITRTKKVNLGLGKQQRSMEAIEQAIKDIQGCHRDIQILENTFTIEPNRAAARYNACYQYSENGSPTLPTEPNEFDPKDWIQPWPEQVAAIQAARGEINEILERPIPFCYGCASTLASGFNFCPKCGKIPKNDPVRSFLRNACVRCDRFGKVDHDLTWAYCPLHGLELALTWK